MRTILTENATGISCFQAPMVAVLNGLQLRSTRFVIESKALIVYPAVPVMQIAIPVVTCAPAVVPATQIPGCARTSLVQTATMAVSATASRFVIPSMVNARLRRCPVLTCVTMVFLVTVTNHATKAGRSVLQAYGDATKSQWTPVVQDRSMLMLEDFSLTLVRPSTPMLN